MASSSADEHVVEYIEGTMVWVNQNHLKNEDWQERLMPEKDFVTGDLVHTFTIHATARAGVVPDNQWWSQQSNVHAHIIAPVRLPKNRLRLYPKEKDALMVVAFVPSALITEDDFPAPSFDNPHTRLMDCTSADKKRLWLAVRDALDIAKASAKKTEERHIGGSVAVVNQGLRSKCDHVDDVRRTNSMVQLTGTQKKLLMDIDNSVAIMDCVAGAGKTTILLALAMCAINRQEGESDAGCVHYMAENQEELVPAGQGDQPRGVSKKSTNASRSV